MEEEKSSSNSGLEESRGASMSPSPAKQGQGCNPEPLPTSGEVLPPAEQKPLTQGKPQALTVPGCALQAGAVGPLPPGAGRNPRGGSRDRAVCKGRSVSGSM